MGVSPLSELLLLLVLSGGQLLFPGQILTELQVDDPTLQAGPVGSLQEVVDLVKSSRIFYPNKSEPFAVAIFSVDDLGKI